MYRDATVIDNVWTYGDQTWSTINVSGFDVEATDGTVGTVDEATYEIGTDHLIIESGPWILSTRVMLPIGVVSQIDVANKKLFVGLSLDEINRAPPYEALLESDETYRDQLGNYYSTYGATRPVEPDYAKDDLVLQ